MASSTANEGARGGSTVLLGSLGTALVQFVSVVVLSRLIAPEDFGLIAMVAVFVMLGNLLRDLGMPMVALQEATLSHQKASNIFWINVALASLAGILLVVATPAIIGIYNEPRLGAIVPAMAAIVVITGVGAQLQVHLARSMQFAKLALTEVVSQAAGLLVAVLLALQGAGYWALVTQSLTAAVILTLSRWYLSHWVPAWFRRGYGSGAFLKSGLQYGFSAALTFLQNNADTFIIGTTLGSSALGLYNRAYQILTLPATRLIRPLTNVVVPTINQLSTEGRSFAKPLLRVQFLVSLPVAWLFAVAGGAAEIVIPLVLGDGWERTIIVFQILAVGGVFIALNQVSYWGFVVNRKSSELLRYSLIAKPLSVVCIIIGSAFGLEGVAAGYVVGLGLSWFINIWWLRGSAGLPALKFLSNGLHIIFGSLMSGLSAWAVIRLEVFSNSLLQLAVAVAISTIVLLGIVLMRKESRRQLELSLELIRVLAKGHGGPAGPDTD